MKTDSHCFDCGVQTLKGETEDIYMVLNELWEKYGEGKFWLCRKCLEIRMGRKLTKVDYKDCVLNKRKGFI
jgi:hypothetical protein